MDWIELGNPYVRRSAQEYAPIKWPTGEKVSLPEIDGTNFTPFFDLFQKSRTRRDFAPLSPQMIGVFLSLTARTQQIGSAHLGFPLSRRPAPSSGAIHPIHTLILSPSSNIWQRYDPLLHALVTIPTTVSALEVRNAMEEIVPAPMATLLIFAAEPGMTAAKYGDHCSLVWRDAGILQGCMALCAEALGLAFCLLGKTGDPWIARLLKQRELAGVGAAFVGLVP